MKAIPVRMTIVFIVPDDVSRDELAQTLAEKYAESGASDMTILQSIETANEIPIPPHVLEGKPEPKPEDDSKAADDFIKSIGGRVQ